MRYATDERLSYQEYRDFLTRCDLGSQYPAQRFEDRVSMVLQNVDLVVTARTDSGRLVGVCMGLTDFAYFLFLTDLGVAKGYERKGIGRRLVELAHEKAGGEADITVVTISNDKAIGFYERCGLTTRQDLVVRNCTEWEPFVVR